MAQVQQALCVAILAEQKRVTDQLIERFGVDRVQLTTIGQADAAAVSGGAVVKKSENLLTRLKALNAQQAIGLALLSDT